MKSEEKTGGKVRHFFCYLQISNIFSPKQMFFSLVVFYVRKFRTHVRKFRTYVRKFKTHVRNLGT